VSDQIQVFVNQLASLVGVQGAFIFDSQGTIQQYSTPMKVSLDQGVALARTLSRTLTGLSTVHGSTSMDIDLAYAEGRLVVKGIEQGGLCIICERQLNYSLLNITLEQGLGLLRGVDPQSTSDQSGQIVEALKEIAAEILGQHAPKVISILESAGSDQDKLEAAIQQAEKMTRMFIDKDQAGKMAERMLEVMKLE
jgi:hypothetical protein